MSELMKFNSSEWPMYVSIATLVLFFLNKVVDMFKNKKELPKEFDEYNTYKSGFIFLFIVTIGSAYLLTKNDNKMVSGGAKILVPCLLFYTIYLMILTIA